MYFLKVPQMSAYQIQNSRQTMNCKSVTTFDAVLWFFFSGERAVYVRQVDDRFTFYCKEEDFYDYWFNYFDLSTDYQELNWWASRSTRIVSSRARSNWGLHVLNQDPWECILTEALHQELGWVRACNEMDRLKRVCTEERRVNIKGWKPASWRPIPTLDQLIAHQDDLDWFCDPLTVSMCISLIGHSNDLRELLVASDGDSDSSVDLYNTLTGIGLDPSYASRVMRHGFGCKDRIDKGERHVSAVLAKYGDDFETWYDWELCMLEGNRGYIADILARGE